ncbi:MAG: IS66 family transposase [Anaerolineae bacterium]|nr:IS66 family transposase [Anaerolineae bacterium]
MGKREAELEKMIEAISIRLAQTLAELEKAREENAFLRKQLYGPKTDRPCVEVQFIMGELFYNEKEIASSDHGEDDDAADSPDPAGVVNESPAKQRGSKKKPANKPGRLPLVNTGLEEREILVLPSDPETYTNPDTGAPYEILRYDETRRLAEEPARLLIIVEKRPVYIKKIDLETGETTLVTTPVPDNHPIDRCKADVSLLTSILIYKYMWHSPLYRLQEIFHAKSGIWIARSTMCGWITGCATALEPIVKLMRGEMMKQKLIGLDDTSVCQLAPGEGQVAVNKLWAYTCPLETAPYVVYDYTPSREKCHPLAFIEESFRGYLLGDAYSGHHELMNRPGVKGAGCWDHARRYVVDASVNDPKKCAKAVFLIKQLYKVEALADERGLSGEGRKTLRLEKSRPLLNDIQQWVGEMALDPFIKESMRKAVVYLTNQWQNLNRYLEDGDIPISNILTEQAMRGVGVGRKNWLFTGSARGGENLAIILSIVTTCRVNRIDLRKYLDDVLRRVNTHPNHRLAELLPDRWAAIREAQGESIRVTERKEWRKDEAFEAA